MPVKPVSPEEAKNYGKSTIPDAIVEAFNELIVKNLDNGTAYFSQKEVIALIVKKGIPENKLNNNHWLDVENIFWKAGWKVEIDKPGFNEFYSTKYIFSKK